MLSVISISQNYGQHVSKGKVEEGPYLRKRVGLQPQGFKPARLARLKDLI